MIKIIPFLLLFALLIPLNVLPASLSLVEINRSFQMVKNEIVNLHTLLPTKQHTPEEEAVIVLSKIATFSNLTAINLNHLPKEFITKALFKGGEVFFSAMTDPTHLIQAELIKMSKDQILKSIKENGVRVSGGEIPFSYTDINKQKRNVILYYSIINNNNNSLSISIYSEKPLSPPFSTTGFFTNSTQWSQGDFKREAVRPFIVTISGEVITSRDRFFFTKTPQLKIEFPEKSSAFVFPEQPSFLDNVKNTLSSLFSSAGSFLKGSLSAFSGVNVFDNNTSGTFVSLEEMSVTTKTPEKKEETIKNEEIQKTNPESEEEAEEVPLLEKIRVDINSAKGEELELLSGVGPAYAERIIAARPFCSIDDLSRVSGIGEATVNNIKTQGIAYVETGLQCSTKEETPTEKKEEKESNDEALLLFLEIQERLRALREKIDSQEETSPEKKGETAPSVREKVESVEINSASKEELELISGIGSFLAERIINARPFCELDDLLGVSGIGDATLKRIKEQGIAYVDPAEKCFTEEEEEKEEESEIEEEEETEEEIEEELRVEINSASKEELELITGVGPATAQKIIEARPFCELDDLSRVSGIGEVTINNIKEQGIAYVDPPEECFVEEVLEDFNIIVEGADSLQSTPLSYQEINPSSSPFTFVDGHIVKYSTSFSRITLSKDYFY